MKRTSTNPIRGNPSRCEQYDVRDMLKRELWSQSEDAPPRGFDYATETDKSADSIAGNKSGNQSAQSVAMSFADFELFFDTFSKDTTSLLAQGQLSFPVATINSLNPLQSIIEARVGSFYFPNINPPAGVTDYFYYRRVYMLINGVVRQSGVQAANNGAYHFEFDIQNLNSTAVQLIPTKETMYFQIPLTAINTITFTFYAPLGTRSFLPIPLPSDTMIVESIPGSIPGQFVIKSGAINGALDIAPIGPITPPGIAVFFSNFVSGDPATNVLMNAPGGVYATNIIDATHFTVNVSFALIGAVQATMIIGKNRIAFPMRFTCLSTAQNGIVASHL